MSVYFNNQAYQTLRTKKGMTQKALAELTGYDERWIRAVEIDDSKTPSMLFLVRSSLVMGEPLHSFIRPAYERGGTILPAQQFLWECCEHRRGCGCPYSCLHMACSLQAWIHALDEQE